MLPAVKGAAYFPAEDRVNQRNASPVYAGSTRGRGGAEGPCAGGRGREGCPGPGGERARPRRPYARPSAPTPRSPGLHRFPADSSHTRGTGGAGGLRTCLRRDGHRRDRRAREDSSQRRWWCWWWRWWHRFDGGSLNTSADSTVKFKKFTGTSGRGMEMDLQSAFCRRWTTVSLDLVQNPVSSTRLF